MESSTVARERRRKSTLAAVVVSYGIGIGG